MSRYRPQFFQLGARDLNEPMITKVLDVSNTRYKLLPTGFGADILIFNGMYFVEVKNPTRPPSGRKLTDDEIELQEFCKATGIDYFVVLQPEEMAVILNNKKG